jgi:hypothetical protein
LEAAITSADTEAMRQTADALREVLQHVVDAVNRADTRNAETHKDQDQEETADLAATLSEIMRMLAAGDPGAARSLEAVIKQAPSHMVTPLHEAYKAAVDWESDRARHILKNLHATL